MHLLRRDPHTCGLERSRWRLADLLGQLPDWRVRTCQGLGQVLARLGIVYKRARDYIHSPDPDYAAKLAAIAHARQRAAADPAHDVLLYLDEMLLFRQPTVAPAWEARGRRQPLARRSARQDTPTHILGTLDATSGQMQARRSDRCSVAALVHFLQALVVTYPGQHLTVVLDNWPVHFHPDLLCALEPQTSPFPVYLPASWTTTAHPAAVRQWGELALPIQFLPLPTYASWCNPIEKVWRKLRQEVGHLHPWADDLPALRASVDAWLTAGRQPSPALLRYVGLASPD